MNKSIDYVNCDYAHHINMRRKYVICKLNLYGGRPSFGVCNQSCQMRTGPAAQLTIKGSEMLIKEKLKGGGFGGNLLCG